MNSIKVNDINELKFGDTILLILDNSGIILQSSNLSIVEGDYIGKYIKINKRRIIDLLSPSTTRVGEYMLNSKSFICQFYNSKQLYSILIDSSGDKQIWQITPIIINFIEVIGPYVHDMVNFLIISKSCLNNMSKSALQEIAINNIDEVLSLTKNFVNTLHCKQAKETMEHINITEFFHAELPGFNNLCRNSTVIFKNNLPHEINSKSFPGIYIDRISLKRILLNLVKNSDEASNKNSNIYIEIEQVEKNKQIYIAINIIDNGIGIRKEDEGKIFSKSFTTKSKHNQGLGLCIISKIINEYNGYIKLLSVRNPTKFSLLIPQCKPESIFQSTLPSNLHVMVVEDEPIILESIISMIKKIDSNYSVIGCAGVKEALEKLSKETDVLLVDSHLIDGESDDLMSYIKTMKLSVKSIIMSAYPDYKSNYLFLQKPFSLKALKDILVELFKKESSYKYCN